MKKTNYRYMRTSVLILSFLLLCSCIRYSEEWYFNENGGGTVLIKCEPSPEWKKLAGATNWVEAVMLFLPPYNSLSQEFASAGVNINRCRFETIKGKPRVEMLISFNSLSDIARSSLFSDRLLQWRKSKWNVTLLYHLSTVRRLGAVEMASVDEKMLSDAVFDLKMFFPGKITRLSGARKEGSVAILSLPLSDVAIGKGITITATARIGYPLWIFITTISAVVLSLIIMGWFLWKKFKQHSNISNVDSSFDAQYW